MHVQPSLDDEDESIKSTIITIMVGAFRAPNIPEAGRPFVASLGGAHLRTGGMAGIARAGKANARRHRRENVRIVECTYTSD